MNIEKPIVNYYFNSLKNTHKPLFIFFHSDKNIEKSIVNYYFNSFLKNARHLSVIFFDSGKILRSQL